MRRAVAVVVSLVLVVLAAPPSPAEPVPQIPFDEETACLQPVPAQADSGVSGTRARLDVLVLLDGASDADGVAAVRDAREAYRPIGIDVYARFHRVRVPADGTTVGADGKRVFTASTTRAMAVAKWTTRGRTPTGIEVVYLLTNKELYIGDDAPDDGSRSYAVAGLADCIGGVGLAHRAFAVGERLSIGTSSDGVAIAQRLPGKIMAHEIGHLLGAHHHYGNCAEHVPGAATEPSTDVCTLMFNDVSLVSLQLSAVNRAIVRGHALRYQR